MWWVITPDRKKGFAMKVITLCGSAKFENMFKSWNRMLTLNGYVVFSLSVYPSDMGDKNWYTAEQKVMLDKMHKEKIDLSDAILVLNAGGYIGASTRSEIEHANSRGIAVFYISQPSAGDPPGFLWAA